jgi:hypothetical protein
LRDADHVSVVADSSGWLWRQGSSGAVVSDLSAYQPIVGKTVESIQSVSGWPIIRFTDGSALYLEDRWGVEAPRPTFHDALDPALLDAVPGTPDD